MKNRDLCMGQQHATPLPASEQLSPTKHPYASKTHDDDNDDDVGDRTAKQNTFRNHFLTKKKYSKKPQPLSYPPHAIDMNARAPLVARLALRQSCHALRRRPNPPFPWFLASAYHSYSLPSANSARSPSQKDSPERTTTTTPIALPEEALPRVHETRPPPTPAAPLVEPASTEQTASAQKPKPARPRSKLRARKAAMSITPAAVEQLRQMLDQPDPKLIKVGVRNRGCSGLAYHLEYVEKPGPFDELVEQDGVKVLIDSKALFSIIGSEMDWAEDKLNQRFVFKNPNIKEQCGCGESFMV
ncbi:hypothetical protein E4U55_007849 [Claviceps digitariae]|nr:hypothetical protein E4U55_007849 [Claviceps digitariae]